MRLWLLMAGMVLVACESRTVQLDTGIDGPRIDDGGKGEQTSFDLFPTVDAPGDGPRLDTQPRDTALPFDLDPCYCKPGEAWLNSACVPTMKLGCGPTCDPSTPNSCPKGQKCDPWGAAACCQCAAAMPACVPEPTTGPITGPLRISPTDGIAGQSVTITVEGAAFYVGALFYNIRMGAETKMDLGMTKCSTGASFKPPNPGIYAVEVSQYGGNAPWVLAGFYTASGGSIPFPTVQPGYPCNPNPAPGDPLCAQANPYTCSCVSGRCQCK